MKSSGYSNRQSAPLSLLLFLFGVGSLIAGFFSGVTVAIVIFSLVALITVLLAFMFGWLEVSEEEEHLFVRFGPLPGFKKRVSYDSIIGACRDRSLLIEGWGVHFGPRGWVWNLWGRDVVDIEMKGGRLRIGTDDPNALLAHLKERCGLS